MLRLFSFSHMNTLSLLGFGRWPWSGPQPKTHLPAQRNSRPGGCAQPFQARSQRRPRRSQGRRPRPCVRADLENLIPAPTRGDKLALGEALVKLKRDHLRVYRVMKLRFFEDLRQAEIAEVVGICVKTVQRDLNFGKAWLKYELS